MSDTTPIDRLKERYPSTQEHLKAIENAFMKQFNIDEVHRPQVGKAVAAAFSAGHSSMTSDDWCDAW